ncbi:MAG: DNA-binding protein [Rhizobacter sp.]|nr:DNA-binding protein [Rhizobacter sp.]
MGRPPSTFDAASVAGSIRSTRKLKGLKLREMAEQIGCSESLLSKIENARISPSLPMLGKIAASLQVSVADLFSPSDLQQVVSRAGMRPSMRLHGPGSQVERLVPLDGDHLLEGNLHELAPGAGSRSALSHEGEEVGYVIVGEFELTVGHEVFLLKAGDSFNFRSEAKHSFRNPGKTATRIIWVSTPSRGSAGAPGAKTRR